MHTTVHIFSTIDGRIAGPFMGMDHVAAARNEYGAIREELEFDAVLYGATTARAFAGGHEPAADLDRVVPGGDYLGDPIDRKSSSYAVAIDIYGEVFWPSPLFKRPGRPDATVIELVTSTTPRSFLAYLRSKRIPYIIAGESEFDCELALDKLESLFGISRMLICGGGAADWSFIERGCVDEVSLVVAPVVSGDPKLATSFDWMQGVNEGSPVPLDLMRVRTLSGGGVHLLYKVPEALRA